MAKVKVYSRFPDSITFNLGKSDYIKNGSMVEVAPCPDELKVTINGTNEVVNHTLIVREGAVTIFGYADHDLKARQYTTADFERLKENPLFKKMVKNGELSIDTMADLSRDMNGVGKLTGQELAQRLSAKKAKDLDGVTLASR